MKNYDILLLSGDKFDKKWTDDFKKIIDREFNIINYVLYENWYKNKDDFNLFIEDQEIYEQAKRSKNYGIIAYQEGCILAIKSIAEKKVDPKFCVFVGFPYRWAKGENYGDELINWLYSLSMPCLFVLAEKDPQINRLELKNLLDDKVKNQKTAILWSDGEYNNQYEVLKEILSFVK